MLSCLFFIVHIFAFVFFFSIGYFYFNVITRSFGVVPGLDASILKPTERHYAVAQRQASVAMSVIFSLDDTIRASVYVTASLSMLCG